MQRDVLLELVVLGRGDIGSYYRLAVSESYAHVLDALTVDHSGYRSLLTRTRPNLALPLIHAC